MIKGLVHIYTGNGKGKTTSALGLAIRAYGWGKKVCFIQFLKSGSFPSGEKNFLSKLGNGFKFIRFNQEHPMFWRDRIQRTEERGQKLKDAIEQSFIETKKLIKSCRYDLIVLDEVINAVSGGFIEEDKLIDLINSKPANVELALTGRGATKRLISLAHYVTEMKEIKHPYHAQGTISRKGIEY